MNITRSTSDVIIIGCGVTGLTAASELSSKGLSVTILDNYTEAGGNHISRDFGPYTFDVGAIFFWSNSPLIDMFPGIEKTWVKAKYSIRRINPEGRTLRYPFDMAEEIMARPMKYTVKLALDVIKNRIGRKKTRSAADFSRYYIGETMMQDSGLAFYLSRFYGIPIDEVSFEFARKRMRWIAVSAGILPQLKQLWMKSLRRLKLAPAPPVLSSYARPRSGFAEMYRHALEHLAKSGVEAALGAGIESIRRTGSDFVVTTRAGVLTAPRLISTIPLAHAAELLDLDDVELPESSRLITLCYRFQGRRNFDSVILYNFHRQGFWKRLTVHSDYYGAADGWEFLSVEITVRGASPDIEALAADFRRTTGAANLFDGALELVGQFETGFAYPVFDQSAAGKKAKVLERLEALGVETMGRQGDFDYIPSATEAVRLARLTLQN